MKIFLLTLQESVLIQIKMEINKIIKKTDQLSKEINVAFYKEIENLVEYLTNEFDIFDKNCLKNGNEKIPKDIILENLKKHYYKLNDNICCAITKSSKRCSRKIHNNTRYCKMHVNNIFENFSNNKIENDMQYKKSIPIQNEIVIFENLKSKIDEDLQYKFIEDEFYYVGEKYIYSKSYQKCGYISKIENNTEYIFTDDPFVLDEF